MRVPFWCGLRVGRALSANDLAERVGEVRIRASAGVMHRAEDHEPAGLGPIERQAAAILGEYLVFPGAVVVQPGVVQVGADEDLEVAVDVAEAFHDGLLEAAGAFPDLHPRAVLYVLAFAEQIPERRALIRRDD